jgi:hypothetical protein
MKCFSFNCLDPEKNMIYINDYMIKEIYFLTFKENLIYFDSFFDVNIKYNN